MTKIAPIPIAFGFFAAASAASAQTQLRLESVEVSGAPYGTSWGSDGEYRATGQLYNDAPVLRRDGLRGSQWSLYRRAPGYWVIDFDAVDEAWDGTVAYSRVAPTPVGSFDDPLDVIALVDKTVLDCGPPPANAINNPSTFTAEGKRYMLCRFNAIRSEVSLGSSPAASGHHPVARNMQRLRWDEDLATVASNWATRCELSHNPNRGDEYQALTGSPISTWVGENLYISSVSPPQFSRIFNGRDYGVLGGVEGWAEESTDYHYASNTCGSVCGHFTQLAWADTTRVGCGYASCGGDPWGLMLVCDFSLGGNFNGHRPYVAGSHLGEVCDQRNSQAGDRCENGLVVPAGYVTGL